MYLPRQFHHTDPAVAQQCAVMLNQHRPEAHAGLHSACAQGTEQIDALARWIKDFVLVP